MYKKKVTHEHLRIFLDIGVRLLTGLILRYCLSQTAAGLGDCVSYWHGVDYLSIVRLMSHLDLYDRGFDRRRWFLFNGRYGILGLLPGGRIRGIRCCGAGGQTSGFRSLRWSLITWLKKSPLTQEDDIISESYTSKNCKNINNLIFQSVTKFST